MENTNVLLVFLTGVFVRIALPAAVTLGIIYFLRRLDLHWQTEAENQRNAPVEKPRCWDIKNCSPQQRANCVGFTSSEPCWQAHRKPSGYLNDECLTCEVLQGAPVPARH